MGPLSLRQPVVNHRGEEHTLFLAMMTPIGKSPDEVGSLDEEAWPYRLARINARGARFQGCEHALDHAMLLHQDFSRFHWILLLFRNSNRFTENHKERQLDRADRTRRLAAAFILTGIGRSNHSLAVHQR